MIEQESGKAFKPTRKKRERVPLQKKFTFPPINCGVYLKWSGLYYCGDCKVYNIILKLWDNISKSNLPVGGK